MQHPQLYHAQSVQATASVGRERGATAYPDSVLHILVVVANQLIHYNPLRKLHLQTHTM